MRKDIGLEIHCQLNTKSKLFSYGKNPASGVEFESPNTCIDYLDIGMPGVFPLLNEEAVRCAIRAGYALNCRINKTSRFDRKHYFYPDLPLGYQITQFFSPLCEEGYVDIGYKKIRIRCIHMECDAGKISHAGNQTLLDYNRSGVPLIEIVTHPDIESAEEAKDFVRELMLNLEYVNASLCNMENGNIRFDVNLSVRENENANLGTRVEIKNLNSLKFMCDAIHYEYERQCGESKIVQETRMYDSEKRKTISMREKETALDYRMLPEPNLSPLILDDSYISQVTEGLTLPRHRREKYKNFPANTLNVLVQKKFLGDYMDLLSEKISSLENQIFAANLLVSYVESLFQGEFTNEKLSVDQFCQIVDLFVSGNISMKVTKDLLSLLVKDTSFCPEDYVKKNNLAVLRDEQQIRNFLLAIMTKFPKETERFQKGETKLIEFFFGQLLKETNGRADPGISKHLLSKWNIFSKIEENN